MIKDRKSKIQKNIQLINNNNNFNIRNNNPKQNNLMPSNSKQVAMEINADGKVNKNEMLERLLHENIKTRNVKNNEMGRNSIAGDPVNKKLSTNQNVAFHFKSGDNETLKNNNNDMTRNTSSNFTSNLINNKLKFDPKINRPVSINQDSNFSKVSTKENSGSSKPKIFNVGKKKGPEVIEIDLGVNSHVDFNKQETNFKESSIQTKGEFYTTENDDTTALSSKLLSSQMNDKEKKMDIVDKYNYDQKHIAINADVISFAVKNSKKLMEVGKKKFPKVSFNKDSIKQKLIDNKRFQSNAKRAESQDSRNFVSENYISESNYKKVAITQSNYLSIDITNDTVIAKSDKRYPSSIRTKSRISSIDKNSSEKSIDASSYRVDDTLCSDVNDSRLDDSRMNIYKNLRDAHNMMIEYNDLICTNNKDDDKKGEYNEILTTQVLDDSLEEMKNTEKDLQVLNEEINECEEEENQNISLIKALESHEVSKAKNNEVVKKLKTVEDLNNNSNTNTNNEEKEFDEAEQEKLKNNLINQLGKNLFSEIYDIIKTNTPGFYFYYDDKKLKKIILDKLSDDFKEEMLKIGVENIHNIYLLIFEERERQMKLFI